MIANFNVEVSDAPLKSFLMRIEKYVKAISADSSASVDNFYGPLAIVAWYNHFGSKRVCLISSYKAVSLGYFVAVGSYAV